VSEGVSREKVGIKTVEIAVVKEEKVAVSVGDTQYKECTPSSSNLMSSRRTVWPGG